MASTNRVKHLYPVVIVTWHDAWQEPDEEMQAHELEHTPAVQITVGFLIRTDKIGISLATEYNEQDGSLRTVNFIPRPMVVRVERL